MSDPNDRRIGRSIGAVVAGFATVFILSVATDGVMHATGIFPKLGEPMSNGLFGLALAYRIVFTVLGGYVTAALAPRRPMKHAVVLAALGQVGGLLGIVAWMNGGPELGPLWYPVAIAVTAIPSILAGARLRGGTTSPATPAAA